MLLERDAPLAALQAALQLAPRLGGRTLLVRGEAGIGKSTLLQAFAAGVGDQATLHWGGCEALSTPRALGAVLDMLAGLPRPVRAALEGELRSDALAQAFASWLRGPGLMTAPADVDVGVLPVAGPPCPVLIFEDVHWADRLTLDLLKFLGRRIAQWPALLVLSYRGDEVGPDHPLTAVLGDLPPRSTQALDLQPLSPAALAALSGFPQDGVTRLAQITGGNPFFASEVIASCREGAVIDRVPSSVAAAVLARLQRCSPEARAVMQAACLVPNACEIELIEALVGPAAAAVGVEGCVAQGLLRWHERGVAFRHELARRAVADSLPPPRQRALHARIDRFLAEQMPDRLARRVFHAQAAGDASTVRAIAPLAARQAAALGAHHEARAHSAAALAAAEVGTDAAQRAALIEAYVAECAITARFNDAVLSTMQESVALRRALAEPLALGNALVTLAQLLRFRGERAASDAALDEALALLAAAPPGPALAMACTRRSARHMLRNEWEQAQHWGEQAIALGRQFQLPEVVAAALNNVGSALVDAGRFDGYAMLDEALATALQHGLHSEVSRAYLNATEAAIRNRHHERAQRTAQAGLAFMRDHDLDQQLGYLQGLAAHLALVRGDLAGARALCAAVLDSRWTSSLLSLTARIVDGLAQALVDVAAGLEALRPAWAEACRLGEADYLVHAALALAEACWLAGLGDEGLAVIDTVAQRCANLSAWDRGELACWAQRLGGTTAALAAGAVTAVRSEGPAADWVPPAAAELAGRSAEAVAAWSAVGMPRQAAYAAVAAPGPQPADASAAPPEPAPWADAVAQLRAMGATAALRAIARQNPASELARAARQGPRAATRENPLGLTPREQQVADGLMRGASNAEMAQQLSRSVRTVEHHVAAVLAKIGARDRHHAGQLLRAAQRDPES